MLQWMRGAQTWIIKGVLWAVVLAFVITIFYQWGVQSSSSGPTRSEVATIYGQPVSRREFERVQNALYQRYRTIFRGQPDLDLQQRFNFREMALEQLATRALLLRLAQQYNLVVTEQELYDHIASLAPFQEQGRFSAARYQAVLRSQVPPVTPHQFEMEQQQDLLLQKVSAVATEGMHLLETEVQEAYQRENAQISVRYVVLTAAQFESQVNITDDELQTYYAAHKETYRAPEQRQLRYVALPLQRFTQHYEPGADDIQAYYNNHLDSFQRQEQVRARHILFKVSASASPEQEAQVRAQAESVLAALKNGEDFATLAKQYSEDTATATQGGDLGLFPRGQMVPAFDEAAFALAPGQLSDLIRTPYGWHLLRVEDHIEAGTRPLTEVEAEIRTKLQEEKAREAASTFVDDLLLALEANPRQFTELVQKQGLEVVTPPAVAATGSLPGLEQEPDLVKRAFALPELGVEALQGKEGTYYLFQVAEIQPSTLQDLETVTERVRSEARAQRSAELARKQADEWASSVQAGASLADLAAPLALPVAETGLFKYRDPIPQLGRLPGFSRVAFGLTVGAVGVAHEGTRHFVMQALEKQAADMQAYETEKTDYRTRLLAQKRQQAAMEFQQFLRAEYQRMRQQGEVVVNAQYVF
ncbi:MAG: SurA N-terminal domain-containing protein [Candidatus Tectimicrobiota bacterium]